MKIRDPQVRLHRAQADHGLPGRLQSSGMGVTHHQHPKRGRPIRSQMQRALRFGRRRVEADQKEVREGHRAVGEMSEALPNVPTVSEAVPGYESSGWVGISVPRNTPVAIVERLNAEINAGLSDPRIRARLGELGGSPLAGSPADFGALVAEETGKWAKVIRSASIKPD